MDMWFWCTNLFSGKLRKIDASNKGFPNCAEYGTILGLSNINLKNRQMIGAEPKLNQLGE